MIHSAIRTSWRLLPSKGGNLDGDSRMKGCYGLVPFASFALSEFMFYPSYLGMNGSTEKLSVRAS